MERAARDPAARDPADGTPAYRSPLAVLAWWMWLACAVAILIDIAVQHDGRFSVEAAAAVLTITAIVYVAALRPRIIAAAEGIVIRNPLREHRVAWRTVTDVELRDLLRVHCAWQEAADPHKGHAESAGSRPETGQRTRVIEAWALPSSRRAGAAARRRAAIGRGSRPAATGGPPGAKPGTRNRRARRSAGKPSGSPRHSPNAPARNAPAQPLARLRRTGLG